MTFLQKIKSLDAAIANVLDFTQGNITLAMPLGIGKPNMFINKLYEKVKQNTDNQLAIYTALTLTKPTSNNDLEQRFLQPFIERLYGNYPDLQYALDMQKNCLPKNVKVYEFFLKSGDWLHHADMQQHYISSNYTHIARDMASKHINVVIQAVAAKRQEGKLLLSLSSNPDVSLDLFELLHKNKAENPFLLVAVINNQMPFMPGTAEVDVDVFDIIVEDDVCHHDLFCTPNMKVASADYAIGLHASSLVHDDGTLQIGIGSLGDAIAQMLILRDQHNDQYRQMLSEFTYLRSSAVSDMNPFSKGLYGCSEMFVNGLLELINANIIRREVINEHGKPIILHAGFFIGPNQFYQSLRELPESVLQKIDMHRISFINQLYGNQELKIQQRQKAAFVNTCMMVTLNGAVVSDTLDNGQVVSGVGGQYNFVAMAHELPDARSILMLRSFRMVDGIAQSNIVSNYASCTIPRHLRDIVVTEYGIADLRGKTDAEIIKQLIAIADSRFQDLLCEWAKAQGKLEEEYEIPSYQRHNTPEKIVKLLGAYKSILPDFPFGHDFTEDELIIVNALQRLKASISHPLDNIGSLVKALFNDKTVPAQLLERMGFSENDTLQAKLLRQLFSGNL